MFLLWVAMNALKARWCWRKDLAEFRGLTDRERAGFLLGCETTDLSLYLPIAEFGRTSLGR
jgi:hypothetical protein